MRQWWWIFAHALIRLYWSVFCCYNCIPHTG
jgi:hypothetical protein